MRILFAGGGTGGHVYMAVAIAQALTERNSSTEFLFIGTDTGLENQILPSHGFPLETINIGGLKNVGVTRTVQTLYQLPSSIWKSFQIIKNFHPGIAVGVGGYASGPAILAARILKIPSIIIEPNVLPGFTNRLLCPLVQGVMVAFSETAEWFGKKARLTGIPIRREFHEIQPQLSTEGPLRILVFGGSRGSHPINLLLIEAAPHLRQLDVIIVHQTGPLDQEAVRSAYERSEINAKVTAYIDDMPTHFAQTDLIISRSGASTVAEITAAGIPALLIPFPHAADNHQKRNAEALAKRGAAILAEQHETNGESLAGQIAKLANNRPELVRMSRAGRALAHPDSTRSIIESLKEIAA